MVTGYRSKQLNKKKNEHDVEEYESYDFIEEYEDQIKNNNSLQNELFNKGVEVGRYEVALEIFKEKNKNGAQEFELILTTQTE